MHDDGRRGLGRTPKGPNGARKDGGSEDAPACVEYSILNPSSVIAHGRPVYADTTARFFFHFWTFLVWSVNTFPGHVPGPPNCPSSHTVSVVRCVDLEAKIEKNNVPHAACSLREENPECIYAMRPYRDGEGVGEKEDAKTFYGHDRISAWSSQE